MEIEHPNENLRADAIKNAYLELANILKERGTPVKDIEKKLNDYQHGIKEFEKDFNLTKEEHTKILDAIARAYGDREKEEWWYNLYNIPMNDRMRKFQLFMIYGELFFRKDEGAFKQLKKDLLEDIKHFDISEVLGNILINTKSEKTNKFPFNNFFLSGKFKFGKVNYHGVLVYSYEFVSQINKPKKGILAMKERREENGELAYGFDSIELDDSKPHPIKNLIYSFCNFLSEREVEIIEKEYNPKNNERRVEKGRHPLPRENVIRIHGKLKKYVDDLDSEYIRRKGFAHWVRGHFFHFRDKKKWNKIYKWDKEDLDGRGIVNVDGLLRKWKRPFIRGHGEVKKSSYVLKEDSE